MRPIHFSILAGLALAACDQQQGQTEEATANQPSAAPSKSPRAITASFDCDRARGQAQELICGDKALALMDREIARLSGQSSEVASIDHVGWMEERDSCDKADELRHCILSAAMLKIHKMKKSLGSSATSDGATIGPVSFRCRGLAEPVEATFVNGEASAVALEWDDQTIVLEQAVAASGAKYEGRWNGQPYTFWNKGREATFTITGKGDLQCTEDPVVD